MNLGQWGGCAPGHRRPPLRRKTGIGSFVIREWDKHIGVKDGLRAAYEWHRTRIDRFTGKPHILRQVAAIISEEYDKHISVASLRQCIGYWRKYAPEWRQDNAEGAADQRGAEGRDAGGEDRPGGQKPRD